MDRLGNIEAFVEAAQLGSFTLAAKRLHISPSALSRRVAQLEDAVGVRLFHRTTRALHLSDDGRAFFERARAALRELQDAEDAAASLRVRPAGLLRVEAPTVLGRHVVAPVLQSLVAQHRDLRVDLVLRDHPSDLASEGIDVALRLGGLADSALVARRVGRTRMRVCGAPRYLRRKGIPKAVSALARHACLGFSLHGAAMPWRLRDGGEVREVAPSGRFIVNNADALIDLAVQGAGLAWVCDFMTARAIASGELVEVLAEAACDESPVHVVSLPSRQVLPKVRAFVERVTDALATSATKA